MNTRHREDPFVANAAVVMAAEEGCLAVVETMVVETAATVQGTGRAGLSRTVEVNHGLGEEATRGTRARALERW